MPILSLYLGTSHNNIQVAKLFVVKDPLEEYRQKEPMTPAEEKEHEPTAVHREMTEKITEGGKEVPNPEAAKE